MDIRLVCIFCKATFPSADDLLEHIRIHTGDYPQTDVESTDSEETASMVSEETVSTVSEETASLWSEEKVVLGGVRSWSKKDDHSRDGQLDDHIIVNGGKDVLDYNYNVVNSNVSPVGNDLQSISDNVSHRRLVEMTSSSQGYNQIGSYKDDRLVTTHQMDSHYYPQELNKRPVTMQRVKRQLLQQFEDLEASHSKMRAPKIVSVRGAYMHEPTEQLGKRTNVANSFYLHSANPKNLSSFYTDNISSPPESQPPSQLPPVKISSNCDSINGDHEVPSTSFMSSVTYPGKAPFSTSTESVSSQSQPYSQLPPVKINSNSDSLNERYEVPSTIMSPMVYPGKAPFSTSTDNVSSQSQPYSQLPPVKINSNCDSINRDYEVPSTSIMSPMAYQGKVPFPTSTDSFPNIFEAVGVNSLPFKDHLEGADRVSPTNDTLAGLHHNNHPADWPPFSPSVSEYSRAMFGQKFPMSVANTRTSDTLSQAPHHMIPPYQKSLSAPSAYQNILYVPSEEYQKSLSALSHLQTQYPRMNTCSVTSSAAMGVPAVGQYRGGPDVYPECVNDVPYTQSTSVTTSSMTPFCERMHPVLTLQGRHSSSNATNSTKTSSFTKSVFPTSPGRGGSLIKSPPPKHLMLSPNCKWPKILPLSKTSSPKIVSPHMPPVNKGLDYVPLSSLSSFVRSQREHSAEGQSSLPESTESKQTKVSALGAIETEDNVTSKEDTWTVPPNAMDASHPVLPFSRIESTVTTKAASSLSAQNDTAAGPAYKRSGPFRRILPALPTESQPSEDTCQSSYVKRGLPTALIGLQQSTRRLESEPASSSPNSLSNSGHLLQNGAGPIMHKRVLPTVPLSIRKSLILPSTLSSSSDKSLLDKPESMEVAADASKPIALPTIPSTTENTSTGPCTTKPPSQKRCKVSAEPSTIRPRRPSPILSAVKKGLVSTGTSDELVRSAISSAVSAMLSPLEDVVLYRPTSSTEDKVTALSSEGEPSKIVEESDDVVTMVPPSQIPWTEDSKNEVHGKETACNIQHKVNLPLKKRYRKSKKHRFSPYKSRQPEEQIACSAPQELPSKISNQDSVKETVKKIFKRFENRSHEGNIYLQQQIVQPGKILTSEKISPKDNKHINQIKSTLSEKSNVNVLQSEVLPVAERSSSPKTAQPGVKPNLLQSKELPVAANSSPNTAKPAVNPIRFRCPTCKRGFHRITQQMNHKCKGTSDEKSLNFDTAYERLKMFKCLYCLTEFATLQEKSEHMCERKSALVNDSDENSSLDAEEGNMKLKGTKRKAGRRPTKKDQLLKIKVGYPKKDKILDSKYYKYKCYKCSKSFLKETWLRAHFVLCQTPGAVRGKQKDLHAHTEKIKDRSEDLQSPTLVEPETVGREPNVLEQHRKSHQEALSHNELKSIQCKGCGKMFKFRWNLELHLKWKSACKAAYDGVKPEKGQCVEKTSSDGKEEAKEEAKEGVKRERDQLEKHDGVDFALSEFKCTKCDRTFLKEGWLRAHVVFCENPTKKKKKSRKPVQRSKNSKTGVPFQHPENVQCKVCKRLFRYRFNLKLHLKWKSMCRSAYDAGELEQVCGTTQWGNGSAGSEKSNVQETMSKKPDKTRARAEDTDTSSMATSGSDAEIRHQEGPTCPFCKDSKRTFPSVQFLSMHTMYAHSKTVYAGRSGWYFGDVQPSGAEGQQEAVKEPDECSSPKQIWKCPLCPDATYVFISKESYASHAKAKHGLTTLGSSLISPQKETGVDHGLEEPGAHHDGVDLNGQPAIKTVMSLLPNLYNKMKEMTVDNQNVVSLLPNLNNRMKEMTVDNQKKVCSAVTCGMAEPCAYNRSDSNDQSGIKTLSPTEEAAEVGDFIFKKSVVLMTERQADSSSSEHDVRPGIYKCQHCLFTSPTFATMNRHLMIHHNVRQPKMVERTVKTHVTHPATLGTFISVEEKMAPSFCKTTDGFNMCSMCNKGVAVQNTDLHKKKHLMYKLYKCILCDYTSFYRGNMRKHLKIVHLDVLNEATISSKPKTEVGSSPIDLASNEAMDSPKLSVTTDGTTARSLQVTETISSTSSVEAKTVEAKVSSEALQMTEALGPDKESVGKVHKPNQTDPMKKKQKKTVAGKFENSYYFKDPKDVLNLYHCKLCDFKTATGNKIHNHILFTHLGKSEWVKGSYIYDKQKNMEALKLAKKVSIDESGLRVCSFCQLKTTKGSIATHMLQHTGGNPYTCKLCTFVCKQITSILAHMGHNHSEEEFLSRQSCDDAKKNEDVMDTVEETENAKKNKDVTDTTEETEDAARHDQNSHCSTERFDNTSKKGQVDLELNSEPGENHTAEETEDAARRDQNSCSTERSDKTSKKEPVDLELNSEPGENYCDTDESGRQSEQSQFTIKPKTGQTDMKVNGTHKRKKLTKHRRSSLIKKLKITEKCASTMMSHSKSLSRYDSTDETVDSELKKDCNSNKQPIKICLPVESKKPDVKYGYGWNITRHDHQELQKNREHEVGIETTSEGLLSAESKKPIIKGIKGLIIKHDSGWNHQNLQRKRVYEEGTDNTLKKQRMLHDSLETKVRIKQTEIGKSPADVLHPKRECDAQYEDTNSKKQRVLNKPKETTSNKQRMLYDSLETKVHLKQTEIGKNCEEILHQKRECDAQYEDTKSKKETVLNEVSMPPAESKNSVVKHDRSWNITKHDHQDMQKKREHDITSKKEMILCDSLVTKVHLKQTEIGKNHEGMLHQKRECETQYEDTKSSKQRKLNESSVSLGVKDERISDAEMKKEHDACSVKNDEDQYDANVNPEKMDTSSATNLVVNSKVDLDRQKPVYPCMDCDMKFKRSKEIEEHRKRHIVIKCALCNFKSTHLVIVLSHTDLCHKDVKNASKVQPIRIQDDIDNDRTLDVTESETIPANKIEECFVVLRSQSYKTIRHADSGNFICVCCGFDSKSYVVIVKHAKGHYEENAYHCLICGYRCSRQSHMVGHIPKHFRDTQNTAAGAFQTKETGDINHSDYNSIVRSRARQTWKNQNIKQVDHNSVSKTSDAENTDDITGDVSSDSSDTCAKDNMALIVEASANSRSADVVGESSKDAAGNHLVARLPNKDSIKTLRVKDRTSSWAETCSVFKTDEVVTESCKYATVGSCIESLLNEQNDTTSSDVDTMDSSDKSDDVLVVDCKEMNTANIVQEQEVKCDVNIKEEIKGQVNIKQEVKGQVNIKQDERSVWQCKWLCKNDDDQNDEVKEKKPMVTAGKIKNELMDSVSQDRLMDSLVLLDGADFSDSYYLSSEESLHIVDEEDNLLKVGMSANEREERSTVPNIIKTIEASSTQGVVKSIEAWDLKDDEPLYISADMDDKPLVISEEVEYQPADRQASGVDDYTGSSKETYRSGQMSKSSAADDDSEEEHNQEPEDHCKSLRKQYALSKSKGLEVNSVTNEPLDQSQPCASLQPVDHSVSTEVKCVKGIQEHCKVDSETPKLLGCVIPSRIQFICESKKDSKTSFDKTNVIDNIAKETLPQLTISSYYKTIDASKICKTTAVSKTVIHHTSSAEQVPKPPTICGSVVDSCTQSGHSLKPTDEELQLAITQYMQVQEDFND